MTKEELIGKLQMVYAGDRNALEEMVGYYDGLKKIIKIVQQENKKYKKVIDKLKKCINDFPAIHYSNIEKVNIKRLNVILIPVDDLLDILKEVG